MRLYRGFDRFVPTRLLMIIAIDAIVYEIPKMLGLRISMIT